jgi:hypothetical protein
MKDKMIWLNTEGLDEEAKKYAEYLCKKKADELTNVMVIYRPDCGCQIEQFVLLDRFPMSPKILNRCPECKKACLSEISDPIIFSTQIGGDFSLEDLKNSTVTDCPQKIFLELYKNNNK